MAVKTIPATPTSLPATTLLNPRAVPNVFAPKVPMPRVARQVGVNNRGASQGARAVPSKRKA